MIFKAVVLFLVVMLVLGMFGKFRIGSLKPDIKRILPARKCRSCGAFKVGSGPCPCEKGAGKS